MVIEESEKRDDFSATKQIKRKKKKFKTVATLLEFDLLNIYVESH